MRKIEREVLLPRHLEYKINTQLCRNEAYLFNECAAKQGLRVVIDCKDVLKHFTDCSNKFYNDEETRKQVEQEYLEKRRQFRETGKAEKSPFRRIGH